MLTLFLRILLELDPFPIDYEKDIVELFDFQWVTEIALVESCTLLFGLLRYDFYYYFWNILWLLCGSIFLKT